MRRSPTPAVTPRMYRHFAMMTLILTATLAFFANGENREAVAAGAQHERAERHEENEQADSKPAPEPVPADADMGTWGSDDGREFGQPMISAASNAAAWASDAAGAWQPDLSAPLAVDSRRLTEADRDELARALARNAAAGASRAADRRSTLQVVPVAGG